MKAIALALALAGCASAPTTQELLPHAVTTCESFGWQPGTYAYAGCVEREVARLRSTPSSTSKAMYVIGSGLRGGAGH